MPDNLWERRGRLQIRLEDQKGRQTTSEKEGADYRSGKKIRVDAK